MLTNIFFNPIHHIYFEKTTISISFLTSCSVNLFPIYFCHIYKGLSNVKNYKINIQN